MSKVTCPMCGTDWDAINCPMCPNCMATNWLTTSGLIKEKHDPNFLPRAEPGYRSVLSWEFLSAPGDFLRHAATNGDYYYHTRHRKYCTFDRGPLLAIPGSGVYARQPYPDHAHDSLVIADCFGVDPHPYTADQSRFVAEVRGGLLISLPMCTVSGCSNLALPGETTCIVHKKTP